MRVVIFDMDGTLIDSQEDITRSVNHIRAVNHGLPPVESRVVVEWINRTERNLPKLFYGTDTYETRDRELFEAHYHEQCIQNPILYPGIRETLLRLSQAGIRLSVATNAPSAFARRIIGHLEIDVHFDYIVGPDSVGASKPEPAMLHYILAQYGFDPSRHRAWMVGDNAKDMEAARRAGIGRLFATWGFSPSGEGDMVIDSPLKLLDIV